MQYDVRPQRLHAVLKARDKGVYPEGPNPDVPWIMVTARYAFGSSRWLDIGTGTGFYIAEAVKLAKNVPELVITDRDEGMLRFAHSLLKDLKPQALHYSELVKLPSGAFDLITCRDEDADMSIVKRLLQPEGVFIRFYPVRDKNWDERIDFVLSRDLWITGEADTLQLEPVEAKGWGSKWSTELPTLTEYLEVTESREVPDTERRELLARYGVGAGVCVEEFGQYGVFRKPAR